MLPRVNGFDTTETYAYKLAMYYRVPLRYILITNPATDNQKYDNAINII